MLCNPNFICKNNQCFGLSSIYFLYPLTSLPKMVKPEMPASVKQSKLFVLVARCWSSFVFQDQWKGNACYAVHDADGERKRSSVQWGKPDLEIFWRPKDNQHKAQISSTFNIYVTKLLYSCVVLININL